MNSIYSSSSSSLLSLSLLSLSLLSLPLISSVSSPAEERTGFHSP